MKILKLRGRIVSPPGGGGVLYTPVVQRRNAGLRSISSPRQRSEIFYFDIASVRNAMIKQEKKSTGAEWRCCVGQRYAVGPLECLDLPRLV